jgi:integrase/recombinase XerD
MGMDTQEIVDDYLISSAAEKLHSRSTIIAKKYHLRSFLSFLKERGIELFEDVGRDHIVDHLESLMRKGFKPATRHGALSAIKMLFKFLKRERMIKANPALLIDPPKLEERLPKALNYSDIIEILRTIEEDENGSVNALRNLAIVETLYGTGMRISELTQLNFYDLSFDGTVFIRNGKGGKQRIIPRGEKALDAIAIYWIELYMKNGGYFKPNSNTPLFSTRTGRRLGRVAIHLALKRYARKAKIEKSVHAHVFRHSFATHLLVRKAPLRVLQELLGHANINSTNVYLKLDLTDVKNSFKQYHNKYEFTVFPISKGKRRLGRPPKTAKIEKAIYPDNLILK